MQQFTFQTNVDMSVYGMRSIRQNNRKPWGKRHLDLKNKPDHLFLVKWPVEGQRTFTTPWARKVASVDTLKVKFVISIPTVAPNRTVKIFPKYLNSHHWFSSHLNQQKMKLTLHIKLGYDVG